MNEQFGAYCICGGAMTGTIRPASRAAGLIEAFRTVHSGDGHGEATKAQATNARRREDRATAKESR